MKKEYIKKEGQKGWLYQCPHNKECRCRSMKCGNCGWNPQVAKERSISIRKSLGGICNG